MSKPYTVMSGTKPPKHVYRSYSIGERVEVREGPRAGQTGVIHALRHDGRPVLRLADGTVVNSEDAGCWIRPDAPVVEIVYRERIGFPMGFGEVKRTEEA